MGVRLIETGNRALTGSRLFVPFFFFKSGFNCRIVMSSVQRNVPVLRTGHISWLNATRDFECSKGLWGRNLAYGIKWTVNFGHWGCSTVYSASVSLLNYISQWRFLRDYSAKPMLSAKRLLKGLHN